MTASWAKAPNGGDPIGTRDDVHEFLTAGFTPVACVSCGVEVLVRKSSQAQTSIQWRSSPADTCPEFAARVAAGEVSARIDTCPRVREAIERAVAAGAVAVPDE